MDCVAQKSRRNSLGHQSCGIIHLEAIHNGILRQILDYSVFKIAETNLFKQFVRMGYISVRFGKDVSDEKSWQPRSRLSQVLLVVQAVAESGAPKVIRAQSFALANFGGDTIGVFAPSKAGSTGIALYNGQGKEIWRAGDTMEPIRTVQ